MKKSYKKKAYYLFNGILLCGYKDKYGFHQNVNEFAPATIRYRKKDIGKTIFYTIFDAIAKLGTVELNGGIIGLAVDNGRARTRVALIDGQYCRYYESKHIIPEDVSSEMLIEESLKLCGITKTSKTEIKKYGSIKINSILRTPIIIYRGYQTVSLIMLSEKQGV